MGNNVLTSYNVHQFYTGQHLNKIVTYTAKPQKFKHNFFQDGSSNIEQNTESVSVQQYCCVIY